MSEKFDKNQEEPEMEELDRYDRLALALARESLAESIQRFERRTLQLSGDSQ